jgi:hypothetical protein
MPSDTDIFSPKITSGFHPETKQLVIIIDVEDVQVALASDDNRTVNEKRALELMSCLCAWPGY